MIRALAFAVAYALIVWLILATGAEAHDWYEPVCCSDTDCAPIPDSAVREGPNGYEVTLQPGQHPMVKEPLSYVVPYDKVRQSPDGKYHACITATGYRPCFYAGGRLG